MVRTPFSVKERQFIQLTICLFGKISCSGRNTECFRQNPELFIRDGLQNRLIHNLDVDFSGFFNRLNQAEGFVNCLAGAEDAMHTYEYDNYYKIIPPILSEERRQKRIKGGTLVAPDFCYASNTNKEWMPPEVLRAWLADSKNNIPV